MNQNTLSTRTAMLTVLAIVAVSAVIMPAIADAGPRLPSYASGQDAATQVESIGQKVMDFIGIVGIVVSLAGMAWSAVHFGRGAHDVGKQYLGGGVIGLIMTGLIYGIASLFL